MPKTLWASTHSLTRPGCTRRVCARTLHLRACARARGHPPRRARLRAIREGHGDREGARRGLELDDDTALRMAERVKQLEHRGFQFGAADGSFELLLRNEAGEYEPLFRLSHGG